jgi:hypothetical protein
LRRRTFRSEVESEAYFSLAAVRLRNGTGHAVHVKREDRCVVHREHHPRVAWKMQADRLLDFSLETRPRWVCGNWLVCVYLEKILLQAGLVSCMPMVVSLTTYLATHLWKVSTVSLNTIAVTNKAGLHTQPGTERGPERRLSKRIGFNDHAASATTSSYRLNSRVEIRSNHVGVSICTARRDGETFGLKSNYNRTINLSTDRTL